MLKGKASGMFRRTVPGKIRSLHLAPMISSNGIVVNTKRQRHRERFAAIRPSAKTGPERVSSGESGVNSLRRIQGPAPAGFCKAENFNILYVHCMFIFAPVWYNRIEQRYIKRQLLKQYLHNADESEYCV